MQFRPLDWQTLINHQPRLLDWIDSYAGRPIYQEPELLVTEHSWDHYTLWDSRRRKPSHAERREIIRGATIVASEYLEALKLELPEKPGYRGDRIEDVSTVRGAVWQLGWPKHPKEVALAIRSREWGEKLKLWPPGETFEGDGEREFPRLQGILKALEHDVLRAHLPYAPEVWICPLDGSRSDYHKNLVMEAANMQAYIHRRWAPDTCVPLFFMRSAAGSPGLWNYSQPFTARGTRNEMIPPVTQGTP